MDKPRFTLALLHPKFWLTWAGVGLWWLIAQLPYRIQLGLGWVLGKIMYAVSWRRRTIARRNLALCFPEKSEAEREQLLQQNFYSTALAFFETGIAWFWPQWRLRRLFTLEGLEHLESAQDSGVILMAMHFTTLDIGAAFMNMSYSIDGMYRPHKNRAYDFVQYRGRARHSPNTDVIQRDDIRRMIRGLKQKRAVWYAPDQDYGAKNSVFVPFFGVPAASVTATAKFARLGKAKVIPFTQTRLKGGKGYKVNVFAPLEDFPTNDDHVDATRVNQFIESQVSENPEQYMWVHRRFKTRPPGEPDVYNLPRKKRRKRQRDS